MNHLLLILVYFCAIITDYILYKKIMSAFSIIISPYIFIILFNNTIATRYGFYTVETESITLFIIATILFYLGVVVSRIFLRPLRNTSGICHLHTITVYNQINAVLARKVLFFIIFLRLVYSAVQIALLGLPALLNNDFQELNPGGIVGHFFLIGYILLAMVLMDYFYGNRSNTKQQVIIVCFLFGFAAFLSFVKYHVIVIPLIIFFILSMNQKTFHLVKLIPVIVLSAIMLFILNYWFSFYLNGVSSNTSFYLRHLWSYLSGGIINTNNIFRYSLSVGEVLNIQFLAFIRLIFNGIFRTEVIEIPEVVGIGFQSISRLGDKSNVVNFLAYFYYIKNYLFWGFIVVMFGFVSEFIYNRMKRLMSLESLLVGVVYFSFSFLSFFAPYFSLSTPWELIFWALIIPSFSRYSLHYKIKI